MNEVVHIVVEEGKDKGKQITVPPEGARLGRSSRNDIVLVDPEISRYHCRLFFKTGDGLWVTDLGSANQTLLNGKPIQETRVRVGDLITVGDTVLKVINDGITETGREKPAPAGTPVVDLGLADERKKPGTRKVGRELLLLLACLATALALAVWLPKVFRNRPSARASIAPQPEQALEIDYEKAQADPKNIFRYKLLITKDNKIIIHIDDIQNKTRAREEGYVEKELIQDLARFIQDAGFFTLEEEYQGVQPEIFELWDLSVTIGRKTHKTKVVNRVEPEIFKNVREKIEVFGKNELGLWWEPYSAEQLVQMAQDSFLLAKKLYNEREIKYGNLAEAIKSLQKSEGDLKTIEPKPDFYPEILSSITDWKRELQEKYNDQNFLATRSIRVKEWEEAAVQLRIICEMIPDRSDPRNQEARKKLLDVESRLNIKK